MSALPPSRFNFRRSERPEGGKRRNGHSPISQAMPSPSAHAFTSWRDMRLVALRQICCCSAYDFVCGGARCGFEGMGVEEAEFWMDEGTV